MIRPRSAAPNTTKGSGIFLNFHSSAVAPTASTSASSGGGSSSASGPHRRAGGYPAGDGHSGGKPAQYPRRSVGAAGGAARAALRTPAMKSIDDVKTACRVLLEEVTPSNRVS